MLEKVAKNIDKVLLPISRIFSQISMVTIIAVMLLVVSDVCLRRFLNSPIRGAQDIYDLGFSIIVFLPMAWCALNGGHVDLDIVIKRLPKRTQVIIEAIMMFLTTGILIVVSWQLLLQGIRLQDMQAETALLGVPMFPFLYLATIGILMMALAFFTKLLSFLNSILE